MQRTDRTQSPSRLRGGYEGGFTLIELLIVIVILAILAGITIIAIGNMTSNSAKAACTSDSKSVEVAAETFKAQTGAYPGGTYTTGDSIGPGSTPATYMTGVTSSATTGGVAILMNGGDTDANGNTIGPWLKDLPFNAGHYQIALSSDGSDTISVYTTTATPTAIAGGCSGVS